MDRRDFVRLTALAGAVAIRGKPLTGQSLVSERMAEVPSARRPFNIPPFELEETTIADLQSAMASGRMTARSITQQYLDRISELDRKGPTLRHVIEINPDALSIADSLDQERKAGRVRGTLHGIPILLKDNVGWDFGMWRHALEHVDVHRCSELVLTNSSLFGPVHPLGPIFRRMTEDPCDFWGMTDNFEYRWHLQSYFLVFRQKALRHPGFAQFWASVLPYSNKRQVIYSYELGLTTFLTECGLEGRAFAPVERIAEVPPRWPWSSRRMHPTTIPSVYLPFTLLENEMPFVKVEVFRDNVAHVPLDSLRRAIRATGYDLTLLEYDPR